MGGVMKVKITYYNDEDEEIGFNWINLINNEDQIEMFKGDTMTLGLPRVILKPLSRFPLFQETPVDISGWDEW
jgi:hypothetical protein